MTHIQCEESGCENQACHHYSWDGLSTTHFASRCSIHKFERRNIGSWQRLNEFPTFQDFLIAQVLEL